MRAAGDGEAGRRRGRGGGRADDAGGDRPAGDLPPHARGGRPRLRDGGLLARAGPAPRRRDPLRGGAVHQPDPGPPRLPRRHGGLLPRQAAAVRGWTRAPRSSTSTTPTARRLAEEFDCVTFSAEGAEADYSARDVAFDAGGAEFSGRRGARCGRGCRGTSTSPTRSGRSPRRGRSGSTPETAAAGPGAGGAGAGPLRADRRGPGVRRPGRLRAHAGLAGERAAGGAAADRGAADLGLRRRRRPRPRQAAEDGPGRGASSPTSPIVTSDNPRSEDPEAIVAEVAAGAEGRRPRSRSRSTAARRSRWRWRGPSPATRS